MTHGDRPVETLQVLDTLPPDRLFPHVAGVVKTVRAHALMRSGDRSGAHEALERALDTAATFGFMEPFRLVGASLAPLLTEHLSTGTDHAALIEQVLPRLAALDSPATTDWGQTITRRELSILRDLATDMFVSEIADAEFISVNTVKSHVAHLYRKLGVTNRRAAVREATRLGLL